jgi:hypothetical protein
MVGERAVLHVAGFLWDFTPGGNVEHLARHDLTITDIDDVLRASPLYFRSLDTGAATHAMIGRDAQSRSLLIYLVPTTTSGIWKPVTGWQSSLAHKILEQEGLA